MPFTDSSSSDLFFKSNTASAGVNTAQAAIKSIATKPRRARRLATLAAVAGLVALGLAACKSRPAAPPPAAPAPTAPAAAPAPAAPAAGAPRSMIEYRRQAARRIMAANPGTAGSGALQDPLFGIAVVKVRLNGDGSIRGVDLERASKVSPSVNQLSIDAVRRVGNFGPVNHLPQPWEFNETFFYDDNKKFQVVTIVENR